MQPPLLVSDTMMQAAPFNFVRLEQYVCPLIHSEHAFMQAAEELHHER